MPHKGCACVWCSVWRPYMGPFVCANGCSSVSKAENAAAGTMCACMCVVCDNGSMRASFSVYCMREMLHRRCVLVWVPQGVPLRAAVEPWAQQMYGLYMVPELRYSSAQWWSSGICIATHFCWLAWAQTPLFTDRKFFAFFFTCLPEKIGSPCTHKACWNKINAYRLPICIPVCAGWVCSTDLQASLGLYMVPEQM